MLILVELTFSTISGLMYRLRGSSWMGFLLHLVERVVFLAYFLHRVEFLVQMGWGVFGSSGVYFIFHIIFICLDLQALFFLGYLFSSTIAPANFFFSFSSFFSS